MGNTDFELLVEPHRQRQEQGQGRKGAVSGISGVRVGIWLLDGRNWPVGDGDGAVDGTYQR